MVDLARTLAKALDAEGIPVFAKARGFTESHQFGVEAARYGGGQTASKTLRKAGFLACGIGLPVNAVAGDLNGLRIGTPELVRWGMTAADAKHLAALIADGLAKKDIAGQVSDWRQSFSTLHFMH